GARRLRPRRRDDRPARPGRVPAAVPPGRAGVTSRGKEGCPFPASGGQRMPPYYLGIEIGGTQGPGGGGPGGGGGRGLGAGWGGGLWGGAVDVAAGPDGIRRQIVGAVPEVLARAGLSRGQVRGVGVGFGGPVDDATRTVIRSHQIAGWDGFPLADWVSEAVGLP